MAVNRFDVGLNPIQLGSPVQIPFEEIVMAMGTKQKQYDESKNLLTAMGEKTFLNLESDQDYASKVRVEQEALVDRLAQLNQGDLARSSADIEREVRKFARRFGPAGDAGAMTTAYSKAMQEFEKVEKSDLPSYMKEQYKAKLLSDYGNVMKGSSTDAFGNTRYNRFGDASTPEYIDVFEEARKLAKEVPLEKLAQNSGWHKRGSQWYKDSAYTEVVTESDILEAVSPMLANNPRALDFLNFESQLKTYNLDEGDVEKYNMDRLLENVELNVERGEKRTEYLDKLNDPSKFKNNREYQNFINQLMGKAIVPVDGVVGPATERAKNLAIQKVNEALGEEEFEPRDLAGIRSDYINSTLKKASQAAAQMYAQNNVIRRDQDMQFDPLDLEWAKLGMKEAFDQRPGALVPTATRQNIFEGSPFESGIAKVKGNKIILQTSGAAEAWSNFGAFAGVTTVPAGYVGMLGKAIETWNRVFNRDEADITHPDVAHKLNNIRHDLASRGINIDDMSDKAQLELVIEDIRLKLNSAGQTTYSAVPGGKEQKDWEEVWGPTIVKGKGTKGADKYTYPFLVNRTIYGQEGKSGAAKVPASDFVAKIQASGGVNYGGKQLDVWSALPYGSEVLKVGAEEFYVEPDESVKMTRQYFANGIARAQYGLNDINYFEGVNVGEGGLYQKVDYRSKYNTEDQSFDVEIETNEGWKPAGKFTRQDIDAAADADRTRPTSTSETFMYGRTIPRE